MADEIKTEQTDIAVEPGTEPEPEKKEGLVVPGQGVEEPKGNWD